MALNEKNYWVTAPERKPYGIATRDRMPPHQTGELRSRSAQAADMRRELRRAHGKRGMRARGLRKVRGEWVRYAAAAAT